MAIKVDFHKAVIQRIKRTFEDFVKAPISVEDAQKIGDDVVDAMKGLISTGESPIKGWGRFPKYINPKRYPGKRKPHSPVNLYLTGAFLRALRAKVTAQTKRIKIEIGYFAPKQAIKEQGHREGANGQPERPTIPDTGAGEQFHTRIQDLYVKVATLAVRKRTRK